MPRLLYPTLGALALVAAAVGGPGGAGFPSSADTAATVVALSAVAPMSANSNCHSSYKPCIPRVRDLDCPQIGHRVTVVDKDVYRLDADHDGTGCDLYPEPPKDADVVIPSRRVASIGDARVGHCSHAQPVRRFRTPIHRADDRHDLYIPDGPNLGSDEIS